MKCMLFTRAATAALVGLACTSLVPTAQAAISDYEFQLTPGEIRKGESTVVTVQLVDKRTGKAVPNAVIFAKRVDMAPDGMETMAAPIEALPSEKPGIYRFRASLAMAGNWRLSLSAKVQGEVGTLENKLVFKAAP